MSLLGPSKPSSLVTSVFEEMQVMAENKDDCWLTRVNMIQKLLNIPNRPVFKKASGKRTTADLKGCFDRLWVDSINRTNSFNDQVDHNKLRTYRTFKASFTREPYVDQVRNRNQRSFIARLRTGSHNLGIERGRWARPVTPLNNRVCVHCLSDTPSPTTATPPQPASPGLLDDEQHFLVQCNRFNYERNMVFQEMSSLVPNFMQLSEQNKFKTLLCPITPQAAKITNRFIKMMFDKREKLTNPK
jgi:hypothetical protein